MPLPFLTKRAPWFAFIIHFGDDRDMYRVQATEFLRRYSLDADDFRRKVSSLPPVVGADLTFGMDTGVWGELVITMRHPEQLITPSGPVDVLEAVDVCVGRGARVIGLGGMTSQVTRRGELVAAHVPSGVTVTNGNAYTAALVRKNVLAVVEALELDRPATVGVVGCTGSVGVAATPLLAASGLDLIMVGRTVRSVQERLPELAGEHRCADTVDALAGADVVVLLTSNPEAWLLPKHVRPGAVVLDFTEPNNVRPEAVPGFEACGVTVLRGGLARIPAYRCSADVGMDDPRDAWACCTETYLFAREGIREHSVGFPTAARAEELERIAERHGVQPRPLDLERIRSRIGREAAAGGSS